MCDPEQPRDAAGVVLVGEALDRDRHDPLGAVAEADEEERMPLVGRDPCHRAPEEAAVGPVDERRERLAAQHRGGGAEQLCGRGVDLLDAAVRAREQARIAHGVEERPVRRVVRRHGRARPRPSHRLLPPRLLHQHDRPPHGAVRREEARAAHPAFDLLPPPRPGREHELPGSPSPSKTARMTGTTSSTGRPMSRFAKCRPWTSSGRRPHRSNAWAFQAVTPEGVVHDGDACVDADQDRLEERVHLVEIVASARAVRR